MEEKELPDWAQRVSIEQLDLAARTSALQAFLTTSEFDALPVEHQALLETQLDIMNA